MELLGGDADDARGSAADADLPANHTAIAAELFLPKRISENNDGIRSGMLPLARFK